MSEILSSSEVEALLRDLSEVSNANNNGLRSREVKQAIDYLMSIWGDYGRHKKAMEVLIAYIEELEKR